MTNEGISEILTNIQSCLLDFIEKEDNNEENFQDLEILFDEHKIKEKKYYLISIFHLIAEIANNHYRSSNFFEKLGKIILFFKEEIKQSFSNKQIFNFFKSNKRLLLFLLEEKLMIIDDYVFNEITYGNFSSMYYPQYFYYEIKDFLSQKNEGEKGKKSDHDENFDIKRHIGENHHEICKLIQKDSIEDFIVYVNKNNYPLNRLIEPSIHETNQFLLERRIKKEKNNWFTKEKSVEIIYTFSISLIEYAAFFGSIQIFKYLQDNRAPLKKSLWNYAIHGQNPEIIHILEENNIWPKSYDDCLIESIKCHHNDIANYIEKNYLNYEKIDKSFTIFRQSLKYHNFAFINSYFISQTCLYYFIKYDCPLYIDYILKTVFVDINNVSILILIFLIKF
ncbi:hypothetical protein M9Y10_028729 [Tritrichomonas musculus]|uniref:DUF3447 domain-containing protein n=1 Tax=Tritrichomonas musculus TaxID=1915356 RepID=A0ABR2KK52_9EUKA